MELKSTTFFTEAERAYILSACAHPISFLEHSQEKFLAIDGDKTLAFCGTFAQSLVGNLIYWWIVPLRKEFTRGKLRELRDEINRHLAKRSEQQRAEASVNNMVDQRFLRFCGFKEIYRSEERVTYEWSN